MGSFPGHVLPGTLFLLVGTWHIWCSIVRYVADPKSFQVRVWNPVPGFDGRLKYLELYVIAIGGSIDLCIEFLYSTHLKIFVDGSLNPSHINNFEHSAMLLMFVIFGVIALLSENTRWVFLFLKGFSSTVWLHLKHKCFAMFSLCSACFFSRDVGQLDSIRKMVSCYLPSFLNNLELDIWRKIGISCIIRNEFGCWTSDGTT